MCCKARGSQGAARVPRDEDGGEVGSMSLRWRRSRNARSGAEAGRTRSPMHPFEKFADTAPCWQLVFACENSRAECGIQASSRIQERQPKAQHTPTSELFSWPWSAAVPPLTGARTKRRNGFWVERSAFLRALGRSALPRAAHELLPEDVAAGTPARRVQQAEPHASSARLPVQWLRPHPVCQTDATQAHGATLPPSQRWWCQSTGWQLARSGVHSCHRLEATVV